MSEDPLELRFPADPAHLRRVRRAVRERIAAWGATATCAEDVVLAVDEACQNVIRHAYDEETSGEILLRVERKRQEVVVSLIDFAAPVDPANVRPRSLDDLRPGGIGTHLIREVMDTAEFVEAPPGCGNQLRMTKRLR